MSYEDGSIVAVFGGFVNRSSTSDHSVYFLDTHTWTWTASTSNSVRGRSYSACAFSGNQFIVWGGFYQNPTSAPNNLPSVEESTMVYSLDAQNWVSTFVASKSSSSGAGSFPGSSDHVGNNGGELSNPKGKSIGLILAIAAVGAILALVTTGGAIMVIRRRNRRRLHNNNNGIGSNNGCSGSRSISGHNHGTTSMTSNLTIPSSSKIGAWDQKKMSNLESGLNNGPTSPSALTALGKSELGGHITEDIPPVTGYNNWEHRGSITSHRGDDMTTTTTMMTSPMVEQDIERMSISRNMNNFTRTDSQDSQTQDSWSESQQQLQAHQPKLEQEFEEKSQGNYFPISVEREYR
ncbi:hypothetical protein BGZ98_000061 [Dissophora globulifera]|nr:hypothetical protein BGZ98_000061 [Dissophora globulifera]